jgi:glycosyltransferase involved in cell wall biosynthesis
MALRTLFVLPSLDVGGAERAIVRLLSELPRDRIEPHLALVARSGRLLSQLPGDVPLHDLGAARVRSAPLPLARLVRELEPRVVLSTLGYLNLTLLATRFLLPRDVRIVVREANTVSAVLASSRYRGLWRLGYRRLYPRADAIVCPSRAVQDDLALGFDVPRERLHEIPNPVDAGAVRREAEQGGVPYPSDGPNVVAVGRLVPQKGFMRLLDAFPAVAERIPGAQLWILGEGAERSALLSRASDLGIYDRVHLAGYQANPFRWMRHANVFVQSSVFEGLPNALLEALACGVPIVAVDEPGGTAEVLNGVPGTRRVGVSPDQLATGITQTLMAGTRTPTPGLPERFRPERVAATYADLFERVAA